MQDDPRNDPEEALRLIKALRLPVDILAGVDADDEAREQVKCENKEKANRRSAEAKRIAGGWYFVGEAASAIAHQQGWDDVTRLNFRESMVEAAALGSLTVRDRSTRIPIPAGKLSTLACMVAHKDVNLWLDGLGVGYQWELEPNPLDAGTYSPDQADPQPAPNGAETAPYTTPTWILKKPVRDDGFAFPLYVTLKAALDAGLPLPNPLEVLETLRNIKRTDVHEVGADEVTFFDSVGNLQTADLKDIRKRIERMTRRPDKRPPSPRRAR